MKEDKRIYTMTQENVYKAVLKMGVPVTIGMMFMVAYNLVDTYFIGLLNNDAQLAATNLAYPIMMLMIAFSSIVGNGGSSLIARCLGENNEQKAKHTLMNCIEILIIISLLFTIGGILFIKQIVGLLGANEETFDYTCQYSIVLFIGSISTIGNYALGQLLRSEGSVSYSMIGMITGVIANIILDPILIFVLKQGVTGAAIATIIGNVLSCIVFISYYLSCKTLLSVDIKLYKFDKDIIKEVMYIGLPHTIEQVLSASAIMLLNNLTASYGTLYVTAIGISNKLLTFGQYIYQGMIAGCQPMIGYNYGAKNINRIKEIIRKGMVVTFLFELVTIILYWLFGAQLIGLFSKTNTVISIGIMTLRLNSVYLLFTVVTAMVRNTYNAIGKPLMSFLITFIRQLILYIPTLLIFNKLFDYVGLIIAQPIEELFCALVSTALIIKTIKKEDQV